METCHRLIVDKNVCLISKFDKEFRNDKYELLFNTKTGLEVLRGINGHPDPFYLELPSMIDCGIMGHCLNNCIFCYQGDSNQPNMSLENFKRIVDETKHHVNQIALGGRGDPNLHENFKQIVEYARNNNVVPNYTTSGKNLTNEQVSISKLCGAVAVSDYNENHTFQALERFMNAGIKTNIHFIFTRYSAERAINILQGEDVWNGRVDLDNLNAIVFLLFKAKGKGENLRNWIPEPSQYLAFSLNMRERKTKFKIGIDSCMANKISNFVEFTEREKLFIDTCESSRMSVYVSPDMKLIPCSFADERFGVDITNTSIKEVWDSSMPFNLFRNRLELNPTTCPIGASG